MYLISPHVPQYKANLHCHSTCSDGKLTPEELVTAYRNEGYAILAITDHESPRNHSSLSTEDFLLLTGYEAYIRTDPHCTYDVFAPETHLNLFAREPDNETLICYNPSCCKYLTLDEQQQLTKAGSEHPREYTVAYINEFIRTANENGYLVSYNHPVWSMESEERILAYEGYFSLELINGNSHMRHKMEYNAPLYHALLRTGKFVHVHAGDDNHNSKSESDSFLAATMISAPSLTYKNVIDAMEKGDMYATEAPVFHSIAFDGERVTVECSPVSLITCHVGSKNPSFVCGDGDLTHAVLDVPQGARYVRVSVTDQNGRHADTRAYTREELGLPPL